MASGKSKNYEYESLKRAKKNGVSDYAPVNRGKPNGVAEIEPEIIAKTTLVEKKRPNEITEAQIGTTDAKSLPETEKTPVGDENATYEEIKRLEKRRKNSLHNEKLLSSDRWIIRNGHSLTFAGVFLFTFFVFYRPYELIPGLGFLQSGAFIIAIATLLIYVPTQLSTESSLTILSTEIKAVLVLVALAIITLPIARDPAMAWETFNDPFIKAVLMFIVMVNVVRTRRRLMTLIWLSLIISIYISFLAIDLYLKGEFKTEGYRVSIELAGLFNNPNDLAIHLVTMMPIVVAMALASKNIIQRLFYLSITLLFLFVTVITFSRGGFLALIVSAVVMVWKVGRAERVKYTIISMIVGGLFILVAPGNYGIRILSIFIPGLDPVGSADARREGLITSIIVTIRNPWGIGIGNSPTFGAHNLQTHNSYTQVSSELGLLGLTAYLIFLVSGFRKLGAIERIQYAAGTLDWFYFMSIGLQASIAAFMVASFFGSVAYLWYVYYLIAYAVAFRRIYMIEKGLQKDVETQSWREKFSGWQTN
jgi:putative inorganic carbon (hco3(-)) transporter